MAISCALHMSTQHNGIVNMTPNFPPLLHLCVHEIWRHNVLNWSSSAADFIQDIQAPPSQRTRRRDGWSIAWCPPRRQPVHTVAWVRYTRHSTVHRSTLPNVLWDACHDFGRRSGWSTTAVYDDVRRCTTVYDGVRRCMTFTVGVLSRSL